MIDLNAALGSASKRFVRFAAFIWNQDQLIVSDREHDDDKESYFLSLMCSSYYSLKKLSISMKYKQLICCYL